jgi:uncharacterized protein with ParB-like and HNH nuclease domain
MELQEIGAAEMVPSKNKNNLNLQTVKNLLDKNFYIPSYQRGYRWNVTQVKDLLNDIANFTPSEIENTTNKTWYCLQPLVVKECGIVTKEKHNLTEEKKWYEVIDGQQRLTTIFLIGHYINEMWRGRDKDPEIDLKYETREKSTAFLKDLKVDSNDDVQMDNSNIDYYYISTAYKTINDWVKNSENNAFSKDIFIQNFINYTKVIWYETFEEDTISIFTRINSGKILLTNAELVKALFLNSSNFKDDVNLKQLEIAKEWDDIEYKLQNNSFWYFINQEKNEMDTRIEFILNLIAKKPYDLDFDHYTFDYFSKKFSTYSQDEIINNWSEIKRFFQTLEEWFTERELFHKIGFLIASLENKNGIQDLIISLENLSRKCTKTKFKEKLNEKISETVNIQLSDLEYKNKNVKKILLLHNIQTMLNNEFEDTKFQFDRYISENWDIEHINSVSEEIPKSPKHQEDWLKETKAFLSEAPELQARSEQYNKDTFEKLFIEIVFHFNNVNEEDGKNGLSNLALLDSTTNRSYKNVVFPLKRMKIIENDKKGTFIPICTKNVFMKNYSNEVSQMTFWGENDRTDYYSNIKTVLKPYLPTQIEDIINE